MSDAETPTDDANDPVEITAEVESADGTTATVTRSASLAEVVSEPREILEKDQFETDFDLYERLIEIDPELAGTIRAQAQLASGFELIHPTTEGDSEEPTDADVTAHNDCMELVQALDLDLSQPSMFKHMIGMGNDISKIIYSDGVGVTGLQSLPLRSVTIIDEDTQPGVQNAIAEAKKQAQDDEEIELTTYTDNLPDAVVQDADFYVLNEGKKDMKMIESWKILHLAVERRGNWFTDKFDRKTYGVWGAPRIEPTKFALQAKHNTLTNKVSMDDSLIAREIYHIDVATLFGHINNDDKREKKAKKYASDLKETLEGLGPDEKPILPDEVSVDVQGPEGKAKEHGDFLDLMNDSIMHALTFNVSGVGRDAGGPYIGNRPAKDTSLNNVRHLRETMGRQLRKLFKIHLLLKHPEWREDMADPEDVSTWKLRDDITLPKVEWAQMEDGDLERIVNAATKAYGSKLITRNEAREMFGLDPIPDDEIDRLFQDQFMNMEIQDEFNRRQQERQQEDAPERDQDTEEEDEEDASVAQTASTSLPPEAQETVANESFRSALATGFDDAVSNMNVALSQGDADDTE